MPPPRPKGIGFTTGVTPARPSSNTPMSERQQMALLIQMTATSSTGKLNMELCVDTAKHVIMKLHNKLAKKGLRKITKVYTQRFHRL